MAANTLAGGVASMGVRAEAIAPNDLACARRGRFAWWASKGAQKPNLRSKASTTMRAVSSRSW